MTLKTTTRPSDSTIQQAIRRSDLLHPKKEESLDRLTRLAAAALRVPISLVTLMDGDRQLVKSGYGLPESMSDPRVEPLSRELAEYMVRSGEPLTVPDARASGRWSSSPLIEELEAIAYVSMPLRTADGVVIGALSVMDREPRTWTERDRSMIEDLATTASNMIDLQLRSSRRAEAELRRSEGHLRSLLANAWDGIHEITLGGRIRYVGPSAERMLGYPMEKLLGRNIQELLHPDDASPVMRSLAAAGQTPGRARCLKVRLRHHDGDWRNAELQIRVVQNGDNQLVAIANTRDITDAARVEQALRESEERYRLVARATNSAIREWDVRSGLCSWNGSSNILLRYTAEEIGRSVDWWYERIHPEDREHVINSLQAVLDGVGDSWSDEYRFLRGDGVYATVLDCCHIARSERGIPIRVIGSLVDVTERRRNEEAQAFLARASTLLGEELDRDTTLSALARLTVPTLADYCLIDLVESRGGEGALRRVAFAHVDPAREVILKGSEYHTLDADPERHPVIRAVRSQEPILVTECTPAIIEMIAHDPEHHDRLRKMGLCSFMIVPLVAHGVSLGVITLAAADSDRHFGPRDLLVAENLAHRAALAIEHAQLYASAQAAIRARDEVLGVVSHDLRNPLNIIHLSAALMMEAAGDRRSGNAQALERIRRASEQMREMIDDLLDISSIEAGRFSVERAHHAVADLVQEACDLFQPLADEKNIRLTCGIEQGLPDISIDARQILRVFSNLVGNAIKFTPEGGHVSLRSWCDGVNVHFTVTDTGIGIPVDELPHVFERFWQARSGDRRGAGLGLAIARGIVEAHGGTIRMESADEAGAMACFSIPVSG